MNVVAETLKIYERVRGDFFLIDITICQGLELLHRLRKRFNAHLIINVVENMF